MLQTLRFHSPQTDFQNLAAFAWTFPAPIASRCFKGSDVFETLPIGTGASSHAFKAVGLFALYPTVTTSAWEQLLEAKRNSYASSLLLTLSCNNWIP